MTSWNSEKLDLMDIKEVDSSIPGSYKRKGSGNGRCSKSCIWCSKKLYPFRMWKGEFAIITGPLSEAEYEAKAAKLPEIISRIRFKA